MLSSIRYFILTLRPGVAGAVQQTASLFKGRFSIRTSIYQFKHLGIVVNVHFVSLL